MLEVAMRIRSPFEVSLTDEDRAALEALVRKGTSQFRMVLRASIVLAAADGMDNAAIARDLGLSLNMVIKWRKRFFEEGMAGLKDRKRSGRPRSFSPSGDHRGQGTGL
jgi:Winged helix-turn helix